MKKQIGDITISEWQQICGKYYICSDDKNIDPCSKCPLHEFGGNLDCPLFDDNDVKMFSNTVTFELTE